MRLATCVLLICAGSAAAQSNPGSSSAPQTPPPRTTGSAPLSAAPAPEVPAYAGSLAQGLKEMERLAQDGKNEEALRIGDELLAPNAFLRWKARRSAEEGWKKTLVAAADPILDRLGMNGAEPADRAAVHYAKGVVCSQAGQRAAAVTEFEAARSLAGPGDLRLDAIYDLGTTDLLEGEARRAEIPEIKGAKNAPGGAAAMTPPAANPSLPPGAGGAAGPGAQPPDPLELAQQAYLRARDHYVERLHADWRDADARANTELVARRLKELEEIKKKREEQKKEQEKKDDQKKNDKDQKQKDKDKQDKDKKDQDSKDKDDQKKDPGQDQNKDSKDQDKKDQPKPDEPKKDQKEEPKPDEAKDKDKDQGKKDAQPGEEKEQLLTKEEVMRLLDRLSQIEEKAREMQAQLRHNRRAKVKKDW